MVKKLKPEQIKKLEFLPVRMAEIEFAMPMVPDDMEPDDVVPCKIDMLRTGNFVRESWYGSYMLKMDEMLMDKLIENFNNKVIKRGVPLDIDHAKDAAYGWLQSLSKEYRDVGGVKQCYLVGDWNLNKLGADQVKNKVRTMFSLEFLFNYKDNEVAASFTPPNGQDVPVGALKTYGPTITGGALTNRPFIPNLNEIQFSESNDIDTFPKEFLEKLKDSSFMFNIDNTPYVDRSDRNIQIVKDTRSSPPETTVLNSQSKEKKEVKKEEVKLDSMIILMSGLKSSKPEKRTPMDALKRLLAKLELNLSKIEENTQEFTDTKSAIDEAKKELAEFVASSKSKDEQLKHNETRISELNTSVVKNENDIKRFSEALELQKERARQAEVHEYSNKLVSRGIPKAMKNKIEQILLAAKGEDNIVELTLDGGAKKGLTVRGIVEEILSVMPENKKVPLGDNFEFVSGKKPTKNSDGEIELSSEDMTAEEQFLAKNEKILEAGRKRGIKSTIHASKQTQ